MGRNYLILSPTHELPPHFLIDFGGSEQEPFRSEQVGVTYSVLVLSSEYFEGVHFKMGWG